jgi:quinol-cytochrome oxidoreductase complex cytochrome b subunit
MHLRALTAITLLVSFIAMSTSGVLMLIIDQPSFSIRMHPVHKLFGVLMIVAILSHLRLNYRGLIAHARHRSAVWAGSVLSVILVLVYAVAILNAPDPTKAAAVDQAAQQLEQGSDPAKP